MRDLLQRLIVSMEARQPVAYCRLVETRGSTPQKAGALMLVFPDGSQAGTLGGGCVEAEVKRRALVVLQDGKAEVAKFQLDSDYGWDDGLICGGRMQILIEPLADPRAKAFYQQLAQQVTAGKGVTEAVVYDSEASGLTAPASYLFDVQQRCIASTLAEPPEEIASHLRTLEDRPRAYAAAGVAYLPTLPRCKLVIVGGGHVGCAVADMAADLDFDVCVVDDREEYVSQARFPKARERIAGKIDDVLPKLAIDSDTYCLIVTRGHNHDERALYFLADRGARYVGMIGSRRKIKLIFDDLMNEGISPAVLEKVYAPVGIDIGSQTVPEIAISICAELIAHRNTGSVPVRPERIETCR